MKVDRIIDWLGRLTGGHLPRDRRTERVLSTDRVIAAAKLLQREEFALVRMHDVEGVSAEALCNETGLPSDTISKNVRAIREKFCKALESGGKPDESPKAEEIVL